MKTNKYQEAMRQAKRLKKAKWLKQGAKDWRWEVLVTVIVTVIREFIRSWVKKAVEKKLKEYSRNRRRKERDQRKLRA